MKNTISILSIKKRKEKVGIKPTKQRTPKAKRKKNN
jgi:hypothetical protein